MINTDLAANIRRYREQADLSQEAAARSIGVSWSTWNKWERAEVDIPTSRLSEIAEALNTTPPALLSPSAESLSA